MSHTQYELHVENGQIISRTGSFFKASPFEIEMGNARIHCEFKRNAHHHVVYVISENGQTLVELEHPDYTPNCEPQNINAIIKPSNAEGQAIVEAFIQLGISKGKAFLSLPHQATYKVTQKAWV